MWPSIDIKSGLQMTKCRFHSLLETSGYAAQSLFASSDEHRSSPVWISLICQVIWNEHLFSTHDGLLMGVRGYQAEATWHFLLPQPSERGSSTDTSQFFLFRHSAIPNSLCKQNSQYLSFTHEVAAPKGLGWPQQDIWLQTHFHFSQNYKFVIWKPPRQRIICDLTLQKNY